MITAAVVLYNTKTDQIKNVLKSFQPQSERKLYIIDNSEDYHKEYAFLNELESVTYIWNKKNLGYGSAHNIGICKAIDEESTYHIIMNPDIRFDPQILDKMVRYADQHRDVVYMLPKVLYPNGEIQRLCKLLPTPFDLIFRRFLPEVGIIRKANDRYTLVQSGYDRIMNPPCLSGCFMFLRTDTLRKHNLQFDRRFFMYCEDFDLMRRLHRVGKTIFFPEVTIIHEHERESYKNLKMLKMHMISACKYFNKYGWIFDRERREQNAIILKEIKETQHY